MPLTKRCLTCEKIFVTPFARVQCCSVSCGNISKTRRTNEQVKTYLFMYTTVPDNPHDCWIWHGAISDRNRPLAFVKNRKIYASRIAYEIFIGPIPHGLFILHSCDNSLCINPEHLRPGTRRENNNERTAKGRTSHGSKHYKSKLTEPAVRDILHLFHEEHIPQQQLAKRFGVSYITIHDIIHRIGWTHVLPGKYPPPGDTRKSVSDEEVRIIRSLYGDGISAKIIATQFGISESQAYRIGIRRFRTSVSD